MDSAKPKRPPTWRELHPDNEPWAENLLFSCFREAPPWWKLKLADELTGEILQFVQSGLQRRYPEESPTQIRRRLADFVLGEELACRVYGPLNASTTKIPEDGTTYEQMDL